MLAEQRANNALLKRNAVTTKALSSAFTSIAASANTIISALLPHGYSVC
jgi:hypothetical protein